MGRTLKLVIELTDEASEEAEDELRGDVQRVLADYEADGLNTDPVLEPNGVVVNYVWETDE